MPFGSARAAGRERRVRAARRERSQAGKPKESCAGGCAKAAAAESWGELPGSTVGFPEPTGLRVSSVPRACRRLPRSARTAPRQAPGSEALSAFRFTELECGPWPEPEALETEPVREGQRTCSTVAAIPLEDMTAAAKSGACRRSLGKERPVRVTRRWPEVQRPGDGRSVTAMWGPSARART